MTANPPRGVWYWIAVGGGLGLAPRAPGTFGSLPGLAIGALFSMQTSGMAPFDRFLLGTALVALICAVGWWSIARYELITGVHDDGRVVIDEVAGQCIATMWLPFTWPAILVSFVLFRIFDIIKKGPVGYIDRHVSGAFGTLADDLVAGVMAALIGAGIWLL